MNIKLRGKILPFLMAAASALAGCGDEPEVEDALGDEDESALGTALPAPISPGASWLTSVNYFRAMAGLPAVTENPTFSAGDRKHACWMLANGISHDELPGTPGYSADGDAAGNASNVAISSGTNTSPRNQVELWMTGPFHSVGILRHNLRTAGFGRCSDEFGPTWKSAGALDVIRGLVTAPRPTTPILWPGNGKTTHLDRFVAESPNPLTFCGWTGSAGLPLMAMMPEPVTAVSASLTGPAGPIAVCALSGLNTTGTAKSLLGGDNAVSVIPRTILAPGVYTATVKTQARTVRWSFTIDPAASSNLGPLPLATRSPALATPAGYDPLPSPVRIADSRKNQGVARLAGGVASPLQATGLAGIPQDAVAIAVNLTVVNTSSNGWLAATNCGGGVGVSNINFLTGQVIANSAIVPLDAAGRLCLTSNTATDVVVDVLGVYTPNGTLGFTPTVATRLATNLVIASGATVPLSVIGAGRAPNGTPVANLTVHSTPSTPGFLRIFPCDQPMPGTSNANYLVGETRTNVAVSRVAPDGTVCLYSAGATKVTVDLSGWYSPLSPLSSSGSYTGNNPLRLLDTRTVKWAESNLFNGGQPLLAGKTYRMPITGARGVPAGRAANLNVTVVGAPSAGSITLWNCAATMPATATLNYGANSARSTALHAGLADGELCARATTSTHLLIDIFGQWN